MGGGHRGVAALVGAASLQLIVGNLQRLSRVHAGLGEDARFRSNELRQQEQLKVAETALDLGGW